MTIVLSTEKPFARGGNRLCFVDPLDTGRCVKVRRPDFSLEDLRRKKGFPKNLKPLSSFDDSLEEYRVMTNFQRHYPAGIFAHVSRCYGFVDTDMGRGLASELIRDSDGRISITLKQYIWERDYPAECLAAVDQLCQHWLDFRVPSRDILLHNIVVQRGADDQIFRLVVVDGLGSANLVPPYWLPSAIQRRKAQRKVENLHQRIADLRAIRGGDDFPGYHGLLFHDGLDHGGAAPIRADKHD
jgi:hypothetical protein